MSPHSPLVGRDVFFLFSLMNLKTIKSYINFHSTSGFFISSPDKEPQLQSGPRDSDVVCAAPRTSPAWAGLVSQSLGAWWALNSTFWASVFTTCSLTEGELFLPSSRKITHRAFLLITAVLLPGSQNHYRSCSICHSWYTFPRQSEPQLALCCTDHHMFQYTAVLFQLHPRGKKSYWLVYKIPRQSLQLHWTALSTSTRKIWPCILMMVRIFLINFQMANLHTPCKIQSIFHTGTFRTRSTHGVQTLYR